MSRRWIPLFAAAAIFLLMFLGVVQVVGRKLFNFPVFGYVDGVWLRPGAACASTKRS